MEKTQESTGKDKFFVRLKKWWKTYIGLEDYIAFGLLIAGILCYIFPPNPELNKFTAFLSDFRAEFLGAGIATLLIGNASQAAQIREEKKRLILQMGSPDNSFAVEAVRQLREHGWLQDGSLKGANLEEANLSNANLEETNLSGVDLKSAILIGANLRSVILNKANLAGANLNWSILWLVNLSGADLRWAKLNGAMLYKANLSGADLFGANLSETNNFADAFYTEGENGTIFPDGFNPANHGMNLIHEGESYQEAVKRVFLD